MINCDPLWRKLYLGIQNRLREAHPDWSEIRINARALIEAYKANS